MAIVIKFKHEGFTSTKYLETVKQLEAEIKSLYAEKDKILGVKPEEKVESKPVDIEDEIKATPIEDIEAMFDAALEFGT